MEKEKEQKLKSEQSSGDTNLKCCPACNSEMVWRIQRSEAEKIACFLSNGQYAVKKYLCRSCGRNILMHRDTVQYMPAQTEAPEGEEVLPFINCEKCGSDKLVLAAQENKKREAGANDLRKVVCLGCSNETVLNRQDNDALDSSGF